MTRQSPPTPAPPGAASSAYSSPTFEAKPPLNPHPTLFKLLCLIFALWVAALVGLYFKTVYPLRHTPRSATTAPL